MRALIRAELIKLRSVRSSRLALTVCVLSSPAIAAIVLATSSDLGDAPSQIAAAAFGVSSVTFGILTATWFAVEYQDRTIATTFVRVPARGRVVLAKVAAAVVVGVLAATIGAAGVAVGGLTQSPPLAGSAMGLVWLGLSNLLANFVPFLRHYGLTAAEAALSAPTAHHAYSFTGALAVIAALTALLLLAGVRRTITTDIR